MSRGPWQRGRINETFKFRDRPANPRRSNAKSAVRIATMGAERWDFSSGTPSALIQGGLYSVKQASLLKGLLKNATAPACTDCSRPSSSR
jgi:hypothetical protein